MSGISRNGTFRTLFAHWMSDTREVGGKSPKCEIEERFKTEKARKRDSNLSLSLSLDEL